MFAYEARKFVEEYKKLEKLKQEEERGKLQEVKDKIISEANDDAKAVLSDIYANIEEEARKGNTYIELTVERIDPEHGSTYCGAFLSYLCSELENKGYKTDNEYRANYSKPVQSVHCAERQEVYEKHTCYIKIIWSGND